MDNLVVKICNNGQKDCYFYKNGLLHRESGPAIIIDATKDDFLNLEDNHLYKVEIVKEGFPANYTINFVLESIPIPGTNTFEGEVFNATYYLNGQAYSHKEFEEAKIKLDLKNELDRELDTSQANIKRSKV